MQCSGFPVRFSCLMLLAVLCLLTGTASAQDKSVKPGINDNFKAPDVGQFVERFEREGREVYDNRSKIVELAGAKPGMSIADIGAGTGLFTRLFAQQAGSEGRVFAVDISQEFLDHVKSSCDADKLTNVIPVLCDQTSTKLQPNSVDLVFVCDTYHHFEFPHKTLESIRQALRQDGQLCIIDFERIEGKSSEFIMGHVRAGREVFQAEIEKAGFELVKEHSLLKENYFLIFRKKA